MRQRTLAIGALALALAFAAWTRLARLDAGDLWVDDFLHVFPAQALERGEGPLLPSGEPYGRGLTTTRLVRAGQAHVQDPELAARLPSALFGLANVLIFGAIAWRIGGPWVATWAIVLLGSYPVAVEQARSVRFYTEQLDLGLIALWFGWTALRSPAPGSLRADWLAIAGAALAFAGAAQIQVTTLSVALGFALALALVAVDDLRRLGVPALRRSARVQAASAGLAVAIVVAALAHDSVLGMLQFATFVPLWAAESFSPLAYYWHLADVAPMLVALLPAIFLSVGLASPRLALYLGCWFVVPIVLHSTILRFQGERYVLLAMPALFLAAAVAATRLARSGHRALVTFASRQTRHSGQAHALAAVAVAIAGLAAVVTSPAFTRARKMPLAGGAAPLRSDWRGVTEVISRVPGHDTIPVGSRDPLASLFYGGRVDFDINVGHLERLAYDSLTGQTRLLRFDEGVIDFYSGVPTLTTPESIREHFEPRGSVLVVVDSLWLRDMPQGLVPLLVREGEELCNGRCGAMLVYHWRFVPFGHAAEGPRPPATRTLPSP